MTSELRAFGANVEPQPDGMVIVGGGLRPTGVVTSHGDHRVAMSLAIAALVGDEEIRIEGFDAVATSWPTFVSDLRGLACQ
jgi:3-phosphoshikimate 1-carboxyvinyltransferase